MLIYKSFEDGWNIKTKIFGLTIYKRTLIDFKKKPFCEHKYLKGLFKIRENKNEKYYYIFGIRFFKYTKPLTYDLVNELVENSTKRVLNRLNDVYYDNMVLSAIETKHGHFLKYKGINKDKEVVLVATGPTSKFYKPMQNKIHVGMNAGVLDKEIQYDYLFINDYFLNAPELNAYIDTYKGNNCKKFYAVASEHRLYLNKDRLKMPVEKIPVYLFDNPSVEPYYLLDSREQRFALNIEKEPFGDIGGTAFSALQFIMYTRPKKVYLVGCDCGCTYSETSKSSFNYDAHMRFWCNFKNFANSNYPDIQIVSINPVGLKDMFDDIYTDEYLESLQPEEKEELNACV